ncbi:MAG: glycosyl hydrolase family 8 [Lacunisphaera sp.]
MRAEPARSADSALGRIVPVPATRNLFRELLGKSEADLDAKLAAAWQQLFLGDDQNQRVYFPVGADMAYIADIGNGDVRSEGMSYGMMLAVQLNHQEEFNRLWKWACTHMRHASGPRQGYFAWQCKFNGTIVDPGSASDGEEWFATALLFASHRWGDRGGIFNYGAEAQALLREMLHKPGTAEVTALINHENQQVVFAPNPDAGRFTDPSYHVPAFYELWSRWAENPSDRKFWSEVADISRVFFRRTAHPATGLMPEYAYFDGRPQRAFAGPDKGDFRYDAWRTLANVAIDHAWWGVDAWQVEQSDRVLRFLSSQGPAIPNQFTREGKPLSQDTSIGLIAMAAVAGQASDAALARPFVQQLWDAPIPDGKWRYYNGMLYFLGLVQAGGRFQVFAPVTSP